MTHITLDLLGPFQLLINGQIVPVRARKSRALLAYLALEGGADRENLAGLLWQREEQRARLSLRNALLTLRQDLGGHAVLLQMNRRRIGLQPGQLDLDVQRIATQDVGSLADLWRGPFLQDLTFPDSPPWDEWRDLHGGQITARYLQRLLDEAVHAFRIADPDVAERLAEHALIVDPLSEQAAGFLLELYRRSDRSDAARHLTERFETAFQHATGQSPNMSASMPTVPVVSAAAPDVDTSTLPTPLTAFVGRRRERRLLLTTLMEAGSRLITIHGPGGIGKTLLATEVARTYASLPGVQGVLYVPLDDLDVAERLGQRIAERMVMPRTHDPWIDLERHIGARVFLLVLDNFEMLVSQTPRIMTLLQACPELRVLVTSRQNLGDPAETVLNLDGLSLPVRSVTWQEVRDAEAVQLFEQRARQADLSFEVTPDNAGLVTEVCRAVGGSPLGIELAAAWVRYTPLDDLRSVLSADTLALSTPHMQALPRHHSLRHVLDQSWQRLPATARYGLNRLGVFPTDFSAEAARHVAQVQTETLRVLIDHSVLTLTAGRYRFHSLVREYVQGRLAEEADERRSLFAQHAWYYLDRLAYLNAQASGGISTELVTFLRAEEGHVLQALNWTVEHANVGRLPDVVEPIQWHFALQGRIAEGEQLLQSLLDRVPADVPKREVIAASILTSLGWYEHFFGDIGRAEALCLAALRNARRAHHDLETCRAANGLGEVYFRSGRSALAVPLLEEAARLAGDDTVRCFRVLTNLGVAQGCAGQLEAGWSTFTRTLEMLDRHQVPEDMDAVAHATSLGVFHLQRLELPQAAQRFTEALAIAERIGSEGQAWGVRAFVAFARLEFFLHGGSASDLHTARQVSDAALAREAECADPLARALLHVVKGRLALIDGDTDLARHEGHLGLRIAVECRTVLGMRWTLPYVLDVADQTDARIQIASAVVDSSMIDPWTRTRLVEYGATPGPNHVQDTENLVHTLEPLLSSRRK